jgi:hypothetical protein
MSLFRIGFRLGLPIDLEAGLRGSIGNRSLPQQGMILNHQNPGSPHRQPRVSFKIVSRGGAEERSSRVARAIDFLCSSYGQLGCDVLQASLQAARLNSTAFPCRCREDSSARLQPACINGFPSQSLLRNPPSFTRIEIGFPNGKTIKHAAQRLQTLEELNGKMSGRRWVATPAFATAMMVVQRAR